MITEILPANTLPSGGYDVANSVRFESGSDDYIRRANTGSDFTASGSKLFTYSVWVKRAKISSFMQIYAIGSGGGRDYAAFHGNDQIEFSQYNSGVKYLLTTNRVFRDTSAWYHLVFAVDTTNATANNRVRLYVNGVEETSFAARTNPSDGQAIFPNTQCDSYVLGADTDFSNESSAYYAETCFVSGVQENADAFGEFDDNGIWRPKKITATLASDSFLYEFKDSSAFGADTSGLGNSAGTVNGLTAIDQSTDTCTNNFATLNPLDNLSSAATFSEGNTTVASTTGGRGIMTSTFGLTSGKWYWEVKNSASGGTHASDEWNHIGIANRPGSNTDNILAESGTNSNKVYEYTYYAYDGNHYNNGDQGGYGASFTTNDIIGVLLDLDNNKIYWSKNGAWADGSGNSDENDPNGFKAVTDPASTPGGFYFPACSDGGINVSKTWQWNFGGTPGFAVSSGNADPNGYGNFEYPTEGAYAICSKNLAEFGG